MAVNARGTTVFVTGTSFTGTKTGDDYATVAYSAATGRRLWVSRYTGKSHDSASSIAVSPAGTTVFVTGVSWGKTASTEDYATVAYRAATGRQLWVRRYNGPGNGLDDAHSLAVSPDGTKVFVTGGSHGRTTGTTDYATVAYRAATGGQLWVRRYNGPGNGGDSASTVAMNPLGSRVFVTGSSAGRTTVSDYATLAYNAATGRQLWVRRYNGPGNSDDLASAMAVTRAGTGTIVLVTGTSWTTSTSESASATVAYNAATGRQLWARQYNGPLDSSAAHSVAVNPAGTTVFVSGGSNGPTTGVDYATVAYRAATGRQLWIRRYNGPGNGGDWANSVAVSRDGTRVFVSGTSAGNTTSYDYAAVAYNASTGRQLWVGRYSSPGNSLDQEYSMAVSATTVFMTGESYGRTWQPDYATIAYRG